MPARRATKGKRIPSGRGGWRPGAGRPKGVTREPHRPRPSHSPEHPVHIKLRVASDVPSLRRKRALEWIRESIKLAHTEHFRILHFSVMPDHLHLLVEADNKRYLSRGMQGLKVRLSRRLNSVFDRAGTFFRERYEAHPVTSAPMMRQTLAFVLANFRRHAARRKPASWIDPYSSAAEFLGRVEPEVVAAARTRLARAANRQAGKVDLRAVPERPSAWPTRKKD